MIRAVVSNAFRVLDLAPSASPAQAWQRVEDLGLRRAAGEAVAGEGAAREAAWRITRRISRLSEVVFAGGPEGSPWAEASARLAALARNGGSPEDWKAVHSLWSDVAKMPETARALRKLARSIGLWRARRVAAEFLRALPAGLLDVHAELGARALAGGAVEEIRTHARALLDSPLGDPGDRERAFRKFFLAPASKIAALVRELEETIDPLDQEEILGELKSIDWDGLAAELDAGVSPKLADLESLVPEAAIAPRDEVASSLRRVALLAARAGEAADATARRLTAALAHARSPELRDTLGREAADALWAGIVARALAPLRSGKPRRAERKLKALLKVADTPARREWVEALMRDPARLVGRVTVRPLNLAVFGCGFGFWGHRVVNEREGTFTSSHGLLWLGLPVATGGAWLRKRVTLPGRRPVNFLLGPVPLKFGPRTWRAALALLALVLATLAGGGILFEFLKNERAHHLVSAAARAHAAGRQDDARNRLAECEGVPGLIVRWRRNALIQKILLTEVRAATSPRDAGEIVMHSKEMDGDDAEKSRLLLMYGYSGNGAPRGTERWFTEELDAAVLAFLQAQPRLRLPPGGGDSWSEEREPWDVDSAALGSFVRWACQRSPELSKRAPQIALDSARRLDGPHLWALAVQLARDAGQPPNPEALYALERFLSTSRYAAWQDHFFIFDSTAGRWRSEAVLEARIRPVYLGLDSGGELYGLRNRFPLELIELMKIPSGSGPEQDLDALQRIENYGATTARRRAWFQMGWRRRRAHLLCDRAGDTLNPRHCAEALSALESVAREIPEDIDTADLLTQMLVAFGRTDTAIAFASSQPFRTREAVLGQAHLAAGRPKEAVEHLELFARENLPEMARLHATWEASRREARTRWVGKLKGGPPTDEDKRRVRRLDRGPEESLPEDWLDRLAATDPDVRKWWIRCLVRSTEARAIRALALAHAGLALQNESEAPPHLLRAIALFSETSRWRAPEPEGDAAMLALLKKCTSTVTLGAVLEETAEGGTGEATAGAARIADAAADKNLAYRLHAAAWGRLPESGRQEHAAACSKLAEDAVLQAEWLLKAGHGSAMEEMVRGSLEVLDRLHSGDWKGVGSEARRIVDWLGEFGDRPGFRAGVASWRFIAWVAEGDPRDLVLAADGVRGHLAPLAGSLKELKVCSRILYFRACLELSGAPLREEILHGCADPDWVGYAQPEPSRDDLAKLARASADLQGATEAATLLLQTNPSDSEAWQILINAARLRGDPDAVAALASTEEAQLASLLEISISEDALSTLWPLVEDVPQVAVYLRTIESAVEGARAAGDPRTLSRALTQRAMIREVRGTAGQDPEATAAALKDAEEALATFEAPEPRARLIRLLLSRAARDLAGSDAELAGILRSESGVRPGVLLLARALLLPKIAAEWRSNADLQRAAALAAAQSESPSTWMDIETAALLKLAGSPLAPEAARRLSAERVALEEARLQHQLRPGWPGGRVALWLAARLTGDAETAKQQEEDAETQDILEGVIWE